MPLKIKSAIKVSGVFVMGFPTVYRDYIKNDHPTDNVRCRNVLFRSSNLRIPLGVSTKELFQTYLP